MIIIIIIIINEVFSTLTLLVELKRYQKYSEEGLI